MSWEEVVVAVGTLALGLFLLPTILGPHKPSLLTSIPTFFIILAFAASFASLDLWLAAVSNAFNATCWLAVIARTVQAKKQGQY